MRKFIAIIFVLATVFTAVSCTGLPRAIHDFSAEWQARKHLMAAQQWAHERQYTRAEEAYQKALIYAPDRVSIRGRLGELYLTLEMYDQALSTYQQALKLDPEYPSARAGIWAVALEQSRFSDETRESVLEGIENLLIQNQDREDPVHALMAAYQSFDYLHERNRKIAIRDALISHDLGEDLLDWLAQDASEDILSEPDLNRRLLMMEKFYRDFQPSRHTRYIHRYHLWLLANQAQDLDRLREQAEQWRSEEIHHYLPHLSLGHWFTEKEIDLDEAVLSLRRALVLLERAPPEDRPYKQPLDEWEKDLQKLRGRVLETLGWALYKKGHTVPAQDMLEKAARILDRDHRLSYHFGVIYEAQGRVDIAREYYRRALEVGGGITDVQESLTRLTPEIKDAGIPLHKFYADQQAVTTFTEVTSSSGLGDVRGNRVAWGDYDGDGYEDLIIDGGRLFRNLGDGTFSNVTRTAGLLDTDGAVGGLWADFNNDGHLDFYMMSRGNGAPGKFWKNLGDGTFTDISAFAIDLPNADHTEGAGWGDFNRDGWVDLYLANYERPYGQSIQSGIGTPDRLWKNNGNDTFTDVTRIAGLWTPEKMNGRGVQWTDYNNDGHQDVFVSNYRLDPNFLWMNRGTGEFSNTALAQGVEGRQQAGYYGHTIGSEWADIDNDADLDLFSANLAHPRFIGVSDQSMLLINSGPPHYRLTDHTQRAGIRYQETFSDPSFSDYDNDGDQDLFISAIYPGRHSVLYQNNGKGYFTDVTWMAGVRVENSWGTAFADYDRDGDLDLIVGGPGGVRLFANEGNRNTWLHVQVSAKHCNRDGIGSRVKVTIPGLEQIREVQGGKGTGTQHSLPVEFGFGSYQGKVSIEVRTGCGQIILRPSVALNQLIMIRD